MIIDGLLCVMRLVHGKFVVVVFVYVGVERVVC